MFGSRTESETNNHVFDPFASINDQRDYFRRSGSLGARARKTAENYQNYWNGEGVQFRPPISEDESGVHSPPLWQRSPPRSPASPRQNPNNYRSLSPTSRTQAIARGQRELMEMVRNMPESCYELSLKDLVEQHHPRIESPKEESCLLEDKNPDDHELVLKQRARSIRRQESKNSEKKAQIIRSVSMENRDLFLKMVFPVSFKSRKKKILMTSNTFSRVSPKPEGTDKTSKNVDKDWWKKRFSGSSGSESGITSSNNSGSTGSSGSSSIHSHSSNGRKKMGFLRSCFSCFYSTKSKSREDKKSHSDSTKETSCSCKQGDNVTQ